MFPFLDLRHPQGFNTNTFRRGALYNLQHVSSRSTLLTMQLKSRRMQRINAKLVKMYAARGDHARSRNFFFGVEGGRAGSGGLTAEDKTVQRFRGEI